jgi:hypothetical protein
MGKLDLKYPQKENLSHNACLTHNIAPYLLFFKGRFVKWTFRMKDHT